MALDDAGIHTKQLPQNTAVYVSMKMAEQTMMSAENLFFLNQYILTGGAHTVCANRINFFYDIRGPSMGVEGQPFSLSLYISLSLSLSLSLSFSLSLSLFLSHSLSRLTIYGSLIYTVMSICI